MSLRVLTVCPFYCQVPLRLWRRAHSYWACSLTPGWCLLADREQCCCDPALSDSARAHILSSGDLRPCASVRALSSQAVGGGCGHREGDGRVEE